MKKKVILGIVVIAAIIAGVWLYRSSGGSVDQDILKRFEGNFVSTDEDQYYWEAAIWTKYDDFFTIDTPAFMIFDAEGGQAGIGGKIIELTDDTMKIRIDERMTDESNLPTAWKRKSFSGVMEFVFKETKNGFELTNNKHTFGFEKYQE